MDKYSDAYKRRTAKVRRAEPYTKDELTSIVNMLQRYFELVPPKGKLGNPANFTDLAMAVNNFYWDVIMEEKSTEEIISNRYICDIYNDTNKSKTKSIIRLSTLEHYLTLFIESGGKLSSKGKEKIQAFAMADWKGTVNTGAPQWADHLEIPLLEMNFKKFFCEVHTLSPYYRFGVKLFSSDGKLFGDASIQSQIGTNILIHIAKNFESDQLFVASYKNGVRLLKNQYIDVHSNGQDYTYELNIDDDGFLSFYINEVLINKILIKEEIRQRACMYVWGDCFDPDPEVNIKNIIVETENP